VMPQMSGRELASRVQWLRPDVRVLFMSGYAQDPAAVDVETGIAFLRKPFTPAVLARTIREVLESEIRGLGAAAE